MHRILLSALLAIPPAALCQFAPPPGEALMSPKVACSELRGLTTYEFTVATAVATPEYCRVIGQILPEVQFEVDLPTSWNRRFLMTGNGGYAGTLGSPTRYARRGFATAATDTGHDASREPDAAFATNPQKLLDYAFRSLHTTAVTARRLITAYYGAGPSRSYFTGCSTGGRQALILAQRFPGDFDGIISGAPILDFTGTMLRFTCTAQALAAAPIPTSKLPFLAKRVYEQCDAKDGLADGVIDNPRNCGFAPARDLPRCAGGADDAQCFTAAQIGALEKIYGDVRSRGQRVFPGWPPGAEVIVDGRSGWTPWIVRDGAQTLGAAFAETFFRYMAFPEKDPAYNLARFDFEKDVSRLEAIHRILDATAPDLSGFRDRSGKLLMYYGWADQALNAQRGVEYYEEVTSRMGPTTPAFFRLFMVPGMFHCGRGPGTGTFDTLTPLIRWVEQGQAPEQILAAREVDGKTVRTRPLCPYTDRHIQGRRQHRRRRQLYLPGAQTVNLSRRCFLHSTGAAMVQAQQTSRETYYTQAKGIRIMPGAWRPHYPWEHIAWVSPPWPSQDYLWLDFPEAIFINRDLIFLSHINPAAPSLYHDLPRIEWRKVPGGIAFERKLPNGVRFGGSVIKQTETAVALELHLRNGTKQPLKRISLQTCAFLRGIREFADYTKDNKYVHLPKSGWTSFASQMPADQSGPYRVGWRHSGAPVADLPVMAAVSNAAPRLVAMTWHTSTLSLVSNPNHPCFHADPKFKDLAPGQSDSIRGHLIFFEGKLDDFDFAAQAKAL
ncbi:MAG: tannase/feruloyl esterase family alpha/beta hydrolase [Acidobacteria bacterium]|nr:tannase/feruloyl esterase family alpha/beta hydrolase [Acidobacteriota bacterium]